MNRIQESCVESTSGKRARLFDAVQRRWVERRKCNEGQLGAPLRKLSCPCSFENRHLETLLPGRESGGMALTRNWSNVITSALKGSCLLF